MPTAELTPEEIEKVVQVLTNPGDFDIPSWMLNRRKDYKTGKDKHLHTNELDFTLRDDLDRLRKARVHRGLRHMWGWKVRGQHTKTTGRGSAAIPGKKKPPK
jgi:small subunit ribosomal protein S18e